LSDGWRVEHRRGLAAALHGRSLDAPVARSVLALEVERTALVLGSTQPDTDVDHDAVRAHEVELARRRSGGGAVLVEPGDSVWIDVEVPATDPLWEHDVVRSFDWLGRAWVDALADVGVDGRAHAGALVESAWSRRVCFGGLGPGEVVVDGRKVVGIAQRRTRDGARFQCVVHRHWDPMALLDLLALDAPERAAGVTELSTIAGGLDVDRDVVIDALVRHLP
jgi:lipoate---protein ligase